MVETGHYNYRWRGYMGLLRERDADHADDSENEVRGIYLLPAG